MRRWPITSKFLFLFFLSSFCALSAHGKEGFGTSKLTVQLNRVRPPDVYIAGTRISVSAPNQGTHESAERQLVMVLESSLLGNDPRLTRDNERPQTRIELSVLESRVDEQWENRTESRSVKTGTDNRGKAQYTTRYFQVRYQVIHQTFSVSYRVEDVASGATLDADNIVHNVDEDYREGANAPSPTQLEQSAISTVAQSISERLSPTTESIGVLLPKGTLKDLGGLAQAGLWDRYLEALESQSPRSDSSDESYRQYALGVAYEAQGYAAEKPQTALSYLEQAALHYNAALTSNPSEKYFVGDYKSPGLLSGLRDRLLPSRGTGSGDADSTRKQAMAPLERVNTALAQYQKVVDFRASDQDRLVSLEGAKALEENTTELLDNAAIIEMSQAGLAEEIILTTVESAPKTDFDVSSKGLIDLAKAKVSTTIIKRLQATTASNEHR